MASEEMEKFNTLRITSLDDDESEDESPIGLQGSANGITSYDDDDFDDDDDEAEDQGSVVLGFVEEPKNKWSLLRQLFPSKAGGTPAWLDPVNLPSKANCCCDLCGQPLQFVLQVYAPLTDDEPGKKTSTFHRTLFMFMCTSMACLLQDQHEQWKKNQGNTRRSVKIFRCQLPQCNPFYSSETPKFDGTDKPAAAGATLCSWCGTWKGVKICGNCRKARYCSEKHQTAHWKLGHRTECQQWTSQFIAEGASRTISAAPSTVASKHMWPEFEIINVDESEYDSEMSDDNKDDNSLVCSSRNAEMYTSMMDTFKGDDDKRSWASFQVRISKAPKQILRYLRDPKAKPLLPMSSGRPSRTDIPNCTHCGKPRSFEFQVLPQLLYYFAVENEPNSLDWATIVVYTCDDSCEGSVAYKEEFAFVQLVSQSTTSFR